MLSSLSRLVVAAAALVAVASPATAGDLSELRIDWATYNPLSLVLKKKGWLEEDLKKDGISVRWVQSLGSNKALEFLNAGSIDLGSTAGAAALLGRISGNPIKSVYIYSKPEWTALVTRGDSQVKTIEDLKGKRIAVTRGTDPHIFLVRALASKGLGDKDVKLVLLQHQDGRLALESGDVDAWAGLDPMMAQAELELGARLFFRDAAANTWGVLNAREEFAKDHPAVVGRVIAAYERARAWAKENPAELRGILAAAARLPENVAARQLERTDLASGVIGPVQADTIVAAGLALQQQGVIAAEIDVKATTAELIDASFVQQAGLR